MKMLELILSLAIIFSAAALVWHLMDFTGLIRSIIISHCHDVLKREGFADYKPDIREEGSCHVASMCVYFKDGISVTRDFLRAGTPVMWDIKQFFFNGTLGTYRTLVSCCKEHRQAAQR